MIISHRHPAYKAIAKRIGANQFNGGYYCSRDIVEEIIPRVNTTRDWITVNIGECRNHSIFFAHNYIRPERYDFLKRYDDVVIVCHHQFVADNLKECGPTIVIPAFVNVDYVKQFRTDKIRDAAFVGRSEVRKGFFLPEDVDFIENLPRKKLLQRMAEYRTVYAIGRTAIEAKILGCEVKTFNPLWPDPDYWGILDAKDAAALLQAELDKIDGKSTKR